MLSLRFAGLLVVLLVLYVNVGESAVATGFFKNEAHPGKCYISEKLILAEGDKGKDPEGCGAYHCNDGESGLAELHTCASAAPPPNCKWTNAVDANADYPRCCDMNYVC